MSTQQNNSTTPKPATAIVVGDRISVTLAATKPDGARMAISEMFNHLGNAVDANGNEKPGVSGLDVAMLAGNVTPEFPAVKYQELLATGQVEAAEDLKAAYELDLATWEDEGNLGIGDRVGLAVLDWADRAHGVKQVDGDHPVIKPDQVVVKTPLRSGPDEAGLFVVQLTPVWG